MIDWYWWQFYAHSSELLNFILMFVILHQWLSEKWYTEIAVIKGFVVWSSYCLFRYGLALG